MKPFKVAVVCRSRNRPFSLSDRLAAAARSLGGAGRTDQAIASVIDRRSFTGQISNILVFLYLRCQPTRQRSPASISRSGVRTCAVYLRRRVITIGRRHGEKKHRYSAADDFDSTHLARRGPLAAAEARGGRCLCHGRVETGARRYVYRDRRASTTL